MGIVLLIELHLVDAAALVVLQLDIIAATCRTELVICAVPLTSWVSR